MNLCVHNMDNKHKGPKAIIFLAEVHVSSKLSKQIRLNEVWNILHDAFLIKLSRIEQFQPLF